MAEFDVRSGDHVVINKIRVADESQSDYIADVIEKRAWGVVTLCDTTDGRNLRIESKQHAQDLIKGIQHAIDLGWFN